MFMLIFISLLAVVLVFWNVYYWYNTFQYGFGSTFFDFLLTIAVGVFWAAMLAWAISYIAPLIFSVCAVQ